MPIPGAPASTSSSLDESEAVNLQIVQEASQSTQEDLPMVEPLVAVHSESEVEVEQPSTVVEDVDINMEGGPAGEEEQARPDASVVDDVTGENAASAIEPEKSPMQKIMDALRGGLSELRTAALSRDEVNQVEDIFMDIKRELYGAEFRGRN